VNSTNNLNHIPVRIASPNVWTKEVVRGSYTHFSHKDIVPVVPLKRQQGSDEGEDVDAWCGIELPGICD